MRSWLPFVLLTVMSWGTYIPTLHKGQLALGGSGVHAFLMVGVAYLLVAILVPGTMIARAGSWDLFTSGGVTFTLAAGVLAPWGRSASCSPSSTAAAPPWSPPLVFAGAPVGQRVRGHAVQPAGESPVTGLLPGAGDGRGRRRARAGLSSQLMAAGRILAFTRRADSAKPVDGRR